MNDILERIALGENSKTQFKVNIINHQSLAEELVAFSNAQGGIIIVGVNDEGQVKGLSKDDIRRLNLMISNVASENVKPPITPITDTFFIDEKILLTIEVRSGINKPYCTNNGIYITKSGADKRRISQEELQRLFQDSQKIFADEMIINDTSILDIDEWWFKDYYKKNFSESFDEAGEELSKVLKSLYLLRGEKLTLAGLLLFGREPQRKKPAFQIKAVSFFENDKADSEYRDSEDISGNIYRMFDAAMGFVNRNLHKLQGNKSFNSVGDMEIPKSVFEELLVNAIIHRDYYIEAPITVFIFDNRVEITSPGKLPNSLNVENIKMGISVMRNPILTSFAAKILPYRGIGSGIGRALKNYSQIEFINDVQNERFKVIIARPDKK